MNIKSHWPPCIALYRIKQFQISMNHFYLELIIRYKLIFDNLEKKTFMYNS